MPSGDADTGTGPAWLHLVGRVEQADPSGTGSRLPGAGGWGPGDDRQL